MNMKIIPDSRINENYYPSILEGVGSNNYQCTIFTSYFYPMQNKELLYYPILDMQKPRAQEIAKKIKDGIYANLKLTDNIDEANTILVGWWDGFMLDTVKKYYDFTASPEENKLFFWVNCGTLWFLLNDMTDLNNLPKTRDEVVTIKAHLMRVDIRKTNNEEEIKYALNDVVVWWNILDYFKFDISSQHLNKRFHGTGIMISTALGSSAYWLNNWGPMMPAGSSLRWISGVAALPFEHKIIKPETVHITIKGRNPVMVGVDGYGGKIDDVDSLTISPTPDYARLWFLKDTSFDTKRMLLAEQKLLRDDF